MADVLSNAGPLMALGKLNRLDLLAEVILEVAARPDIWISARLSEQVLAALKNEAREAS